MISTLKPSTTILARQADRESNARTYARNLGLVLAKASGVYVTMQTLDLSIPVKDEFVAEIFASLPPEFAQTAGDLAVYSRT
jgi:diaminobutyrate-2-oxoglutarate transaminase